MKSKRGKNRLARLSSTNKPAIKTRNKPIVKTPTSSLVESNDDNSNFSSPKEIYDDKTADSTHANQSIDPSLAKKSSRREIKAFLKQSRKSKIVLDEKFIAVMEELTNMMDKSCLIDFNTRITNKKIPILNSKLTQPPARGRKKKNQKKVQKESIVSWCPLVLPNDENFLKLFNLPQNSVEIESNQLHPDIIINGGYVDFTSKPVDRFCKLSNHRVNRYLNNVVNFVNSIGSNSQPSNDTVKTKQSNSKSNPITSRFLQHCDEGKHSSVNTTPEMSNTSSMNSNDHNLHKNDSQKNELDDSTMKKSFLSYANRKADIKKSCNNNNSVKRELKGLVTWASMVAAEEKGLTSGYVAKNEESLKQTLDLQVSSDNSESNCRTRRTSIASGSSNANRQSFLNTPTNSNGKQNTETDSLPEEKPLENKSKKTPSIHSQSPSLSSSSKSPKKTRNGSARMRSRARHYPARKTPQSTGDAAINSLKDDMSDISYDEYNEHQRNLCPGSSPLTDQKLDSNISPHTMTLPPRKRYKTQQVNHNHLDVPSDPETLGQDFETKTNESNFNADNEISDPDDNLPPAKVPSLASVERKRGRPKSIREDSSMNEGKKSAGVRSKRDRSKVAQTGLTDIVRDSLNASKSGMEDENTHICISSDREAQAEKAPSKRSRNANKTSPEAPEKKKPKITAPGGMERLTHSSLDNLPPDMDPIILVPFSRIPELENDLKKQDCPVLMKRNHSIYRRFISHQMLNSGQSEQPSEGKILRGSSSRVSINRFSMFRDSSMKCTPSVVKKLEKFSASVIHPLLMKVINAPAPDDPDSRLFSPIFHLPSKRKYLELFRFFSQCPLPRNSPLSIDCLVNLLTDDKSIVTTDYQYLINYIPVIELHKCLPIIDQCLEVMLITWEAFAGRKSWLGRQLFTMRTSFYEIRRLFIDDLIEKGHAEAEKLKPTASTLTRLGNSLLTTSALFSSTKKKIEKRQFEKGCEVIKCLCGFRVEGGHSMVQCDLCASWQHLPCLWWAINCKLRPNINQSLVTSLHTKAIPDSTLEISTKDGLTKRCKDALEAAMNVGLADTANKKSAHINDSDSPYICTFCLGFDDLILDYPQNLADAMMQNDLNLVFQEQRKTQSKQMKFDYWSLGHNPHGDLLTKIAKDVDRNAKQIRTDDYVFIPRKLWALYREANANHWPTDMSSFLSKIKDVDFGWDDKSLYGNIVLRIYQLWKDSTGQSWIEAGAFLRPYDLGCIAQEATHRWHSQEVIYDEANKIVVPVEYVRGRCAVLSPSAYRQGRPVDLSCFDNCYPDENSPYVFLCQKIITKSSTRPDEIILDEIEPGYLKVLQKPYCFLKHQENSILRSPIVHDMKTDEIKVRDESTSLEFYYLLPDEASDSSNIVPHAEVEVQEAEKKVPLRKISVIIEKIKNMKPKTKICKTIRNLSKALPYKHHPRKSLKSNTSKNEPIAMPPIASVESEVKIDQIELSISREEEDLNNKPSSSKRTKIDRKSSKPRKISFVPQEEIVQPSALFTCSEKDILVEQVDEFHIAKNVHVAEQSLEPIPESCTLIQSYHHQKLLSHAQLLSINTPIVVLTSFDNVELREVNIQEAPVELDADAISNPKENTPIQDTPTSNSNQSPINESVTEENPYHEPIPVQKPVNSNLDESMTTMQEINPDTCKLDKEYPDNIIQDKSDHSSSNSKTAQQAELSARDDSLPTSQNITTTIREEVLPDHKIQTKETLPPEDDEEDNELFQTYPKEEIPDNTSNSDSTPDQNREHPINSIEDQNPTDIPNNPLTPDDINEDVKASSSPKSIDDSTVEISNPTIKTLYPSSQEPDPVDSPKDVPIFNDSEPSSPIRNPDELDIIDSDNEFKLVCYSDEDEMYSSKEDSQLSNELAETNTNFLISEYKEK